jgi:hypothetical protein
MKGLTQQSCRQNDPQVNEKRFGSGTTGILIQTGKTG